MAGTGHFWDKLRSHCISNFFNVIQLTAIGLFVPGMIMANVAPPLPEHYHHKYRTWGSMFTNLKTTFMVSMHLTNARDIEALRVNMSAYSGEEFELDEDELASVEPYATFFTTGRVMVALATMLFYFRLLHFYMIHKVLEQI